MLKPQQIDIQGETLAVKLLQVTVLSGGYQLTDTHSESEPMSSIYFLLNYYCWVYCYLLLLLLLLLHSMVVIVTLK